jgi:hypothetical protein
VLRLDHVVYAVHDLDVAAERWRRELGLDSAPGGRHERWGTANRIVPLGDQYVELIAVVDPGEAGNTGFGRSVLDRSAAGEGWLATVVATDGIAEVARRIGLDVEEGRRRRPDGSEVRWRSAGFGDPRREPWMPFFVQWDVPAEDHPGRTRAGHGIRVDGIAWVEVGGDPARLAEWLGEANPAIRVVDAGPGLRRVALSAADGELVID